MCQPLESLQTPAGREVEVTIPDDRQWRRITRRMGPPSFLIEPVGLDNTGSRQIYAARDLGLSVQVTRDGAAVAVTPTSDALR